MSDRLNVRVDEESKKAAVEILDGLGVSLSAAINMYLHQIELKKGIPFEISLPKAEEKLSQTEIMKRNIQAAIHAEVQELKENEIPIAMFDEETKRPYLLYPDGRKEFLSDGCIA